MWVVVMAAWKRRNGQPMMGMYVTSHLWYLYTHIHRHDFNSALGQGKTFADWDNIKHHWDAYAQQAIGGEEHMIAMMMLDQCSAGRKGRRG